MKKFLYIYLIFAIVFAIPTGFFVKSFFGLVENLNIVSNGVETTADVMSYNLGITINDTDYYYLTFVYEDKDGVEHKGKTSSAYTYSQATSMTKVKIKYTSDFKSIEADYTFSLSKDFYIPFLGIFALVDLGLWIVFVKSLLGARTDSNVRKYGEESVGTFVMSGSNTYINDSAIYWIEFQYTDKDGNVVSKRTRSMYSYYEKRYFEYLKTFKIKVLNKDVVITEPIDVSKIYDLELKQFNANNVDNAQSEENVQIEKKPPEFKRCYYCGSIITETDRKCPCCGSRKFHIDKKESSNDAFKM